MNDFGNLATQIVTYEFPEDTGTYPVSYVSGWLEANLGELNLLTNEEFSVNSTGAIILGTGESSSAGLLPQELDIFKTLYEIHYYEKSARESLRSATYGSSTDWLTLKEGDTTIQRQNKNSVARTFRELLADSRKNLENLVFRYNRYRSGPRQVHGLDGIPSVDAFNSTNPYQIRE